MKQALESVRGRWRAIEPGTRLMMIVGLLGLAVASYVVYQRSNQVDWAVLYANVDDATASKVLAGLDAHGVQYQVQGNGTRILVPRDQLSTTRVALAGEGITAQAVPQGFNEIFAQQGLASSDFEQRVNYQRALEGELARTLLAMEPVAGARVQLSIPQPSLFVSSDTSAQNQPSASVMLSLRRDLKHSEADTIANIVASAVQGMSPDQVTIASSDGTMLRAPGAANADGGTQANLQLTSDYETALSTRLTTLVRTMTGQATATVEVRAKFDFTQSTTEHQTVDPTKKSITADHTIDETWTGTGSQAAGAVGADGGPSTGANGNGTYTKKEQTTTYDQGDKTITKSSSTTPTLSQIHVAVVVPVVTPAGGATPRLDEAKLKSVVGTAAGIDKSQLDNSVDVAIVQAAGTDGGGLITDPSGTGTTTTPTGTGSSMPIDLLAAAAGGGAFLMLVISFLGGRRRKKRLQLAEPMVAGKRGRGTKTGKKGEVVAEPPPHTVPKANPMDPDRQAVEEIKHDLERMVAESPESLAALLSTWMAK